MIVHWLFKRFNWNWKDRISYWKVYKPICCMFQKERHHSKNNKFISRLRSHNTYRDHILCDEFKKSALTLIFQQKRSKRYWRTLIPVKKFTLKLNTARKSALSAIFLFYHRYPYNLYISHSLLSSVKYFAAEVSPMWTYTLACVTQSQWNYQILRIFLKPEKYLHQVNRPKCQNALFIYKQNIHIK